VTLVTAGGDVAGVLARAMNGALDKVPGTVRQAEVAEIQERPPARDRRRWRRRCGS
jgi:uncharacterized NAD(P)/FAD-binding protein YdhS